MKYVLDASIGEKWYVAQQGTTKAMKLRHDFRLGLHEFLAPDIFLVECAGVLAKAEKSGDLDLGEALRFFNSLQTVGVPLHPSIPLLPRALAIALSTRLTHFAGLYLALAEREQCQLLTADPKILRHTRKYFPFVVAFDLLP